MSDILPFYRGVNFSGLEYDRGHQPPIQYAPAYYLGQKRMNVVRLGFLWELMQPVVGGPLDPAFVAIVHKQIAGIRAYLGATILDLHNYGRRMVNGAEVIVGETPALTIAHFADFWTKLATEFGGDDMIYGLMNEPHDQDHEVCLRAINAGIFAIRSTGRPNLVMVGLPDWSGRYTFVAGTSAISLATRIVDPYANFALDYHCYLDPGSTGSQDPKMVAIVEPNVLSQVQDFTANCRSYGLRTMMTEFACSSAPNAMSAMSGVLDWVEANKDVWLGWCWLGAGGYLAHDVPWLLDPYASPFDVGNPQRIAAQTWAPPLVDKPQMAMLGRYLR